MDWELLKRLGWLESDVSVDTLYSNWLVGYSSLLGPIAGIMVVDYFVVRRQHYDLPGLYLDSAVSGVNVAGSRVSRACGVHAGRDTTARCSGSQLRWSTGSLLGGSIYYLVSRRSMQKSAVAESVASGA
jgi:NCS1 family nucleobase:cation symporter-1